MHAGTFERVGRGPSVLDGPGTLTVTDAGLRVQGAAVRSVLVTALAGAAGAAAMTGAVIAAFAVLDDLDRVSDGESLRPAVSVGVAALVGVYLGARALLVRLLPRGPFDRVVPLRYLVSAALEDGVLHLACTAPGCSGRITFRTADPAGLLREIERAKGA